MHVVVQRLNARIPTVQRDWPPKSAFRIVSKARRNDASWQRGSSNRELRDIIQSKGEVVSVRATYVCMLIAISTTLNFMYFTCSPRWF